MRPYAVRLLTLTIYATTAVAVSAVTASEAEASSRHVRKHHQQTRLGSNDPLRRSWAAEQAHPTALSWSQGGDICAGAARSFHCKMWPPPIDDDPDRKGTDGGP